MILGREENESDKRRVQQLAEEVWALLPKNVPQTQTLQDCLNVTEISHLIMTIVFNSTFESFLLGIRVIPHSHFLHLTLRHRLSHAPTKYPMQLSVHGLIVADESAVSSIASKIRSAVEDVEKEAGALSGTQVLSYSTFHRAPSRHITLLSSHSHLISSFQKSPNQTQPNST